MKKSDSDVLKSATNYINGGFYGPVRPKANTNGTEAEVQSPMFHVYRRKWYGEKLFCICTEVQQYDEVILCKKNEIVIGILPMKDFSCAINLNMQ